MEPSVLEDVLNSRDGRVGGAVFFSGGPVTAAVSTYVPCHAILVRAGDAKPLLG